VVLTGQASKSIADQQQAVADAHAKNAQAEADAAESLADQAKGDAKEAYQHAADAAQYRRMPAVDVDREALLSKPVGYTAQVVGRRSADGSAWASGTS
jgi:hypothetical protein